MQEHHPSPTKAVVETTPLVGGGTVSTTGSKSEAEVHKEANLKKHVLSYLRIFSRSKGLL
jgi:hypothetical protein